MPDNDAEYQRILNELDSALQSNQPKKLIAMALLDIGGLLLRKNQNYGGSVFHSPVLTPTVHPLTALSVRESDKIARRIELGSGSPDLVGETLADTELDHAGYLVLRRALRLLEATP